MAKKESKITLDKVKKMQSLLNACEQDIADMIAFNKLLKKIVERNEKLIAFNDEEWILFYESNIDTKGEIYTVLNQDSVYNAIADTHIESVKMMKRLVSML